jgi:hypothetical protein
MIYILYDTCGTCTFTSSIRSIGMCGDAWKRCYKRRKGAPSCPSLWSPHRHGRAGQPSCSTVRSPARLALDTALLRAEACGETVVVCKTGQGRDAGVVPTGGERAAPIPIGRRSADNDRSLGRDNLPTSVDFLFLD